MIKFTQDLSISNKKNGEYLLGVYFRASKLSKKPNYPITNLKSMMAFYEKKYPTFIEYLGGQAKDIPMDKLIAIVRGLAEKSDASYPIPAKFSSAIGSQFSIGTPEIISAGIKDSVSAIGDFSLGVGKFILVAVLIVGGFIIYEKFKK